MSSLPLDALRECLDGGTPSVVATCSRDGTPNVSYLSQVHYVDAEHVALSFQFFSKTRRNVLENPVARILVWHPESAAMYRMRVRYVRTETEGPTFERMRAMLAGIASHTGMSEVFFLRGADVYRVEEVAAVPARKTAPHAPRPPRLPRLRLATERLLGAVDLDGLLQAALDGLARDLDVTHAMILLHDPARALLYTVATRGYAEAGFGAEIPIGAGVAGVAARERVPVRIRHVTSDRAYVSAAREESAKAHEVAWPGLASPGSQVAVPIAPGGQLLGVVFAESPHAGRYDYEDEDALAIFGAHLGTAMLSLQRFPDEDVTMSPVFAPEAPVAGSAVELKRYRADDSVFADGEYLIKGVAGAILWAMASDYVASGRVAFTNRELRRDPRVPLPEIGDNLEARLVLLQRRLADRGAAIRVERAGRGRLRLDVIRPLRLVEI